MTTGIEILPGLAAQKLPPQNLEAEQSVLGSLLIDKDAVAQVAEVLQSEDFYREAHRILYDTMLRLFERAEPIDVVTVAEELTRKGKLEVVGGVDALMYLINLVPNAANVRHYARIVEEKSVLRKLIRAGTQITQDSYEWTEKVDVLLDRSEASIFAVAQRKFSQFFVPVRQVLIEAFQKVEELYKRKSGITGIPTGFEDLDHITAGMQPSDLIVVAARPSMGKTSFCLNIAQHAAVKENLPIAIFSLEMSRDQLAQRMLCSEAGIDAQRLRSGRLAEVEWSKLSYALGVLSEAPIFIDDSAALTVIEVRSKARRLKAEKGLKMIVVDYLQLLRGSSRTENRTQEISEISRGLKALAKELEVPVVALSQLSREVEKRTDKRPILSDLRESGAIEQEADVVAFIYRDDYYNPDKTDKKNIAEIIVAKQRNGPIGNIELYWQKEFTKFISLSKTR
ncbi:MAG: replicative DNA helicase [Armatimonadetes bacterium]|nr:replicative DNA helicase [Armatimonadota bacterium]